MNGNYFTKFEITKKIFHILDPLGVCVTLIIGERQALLFDTSNGIGNLKEYISQHTSMPLIVINSHGHIDHISGNYQFDKIYMHEADLPLAKEHGSIYLREYVIKEAKLKNVQPPGFDENAFLNAGFDNIIPIKEGHCFDLGGLTLEVISVPGHTRGSIALLCREEKILLLGDAANKFLLLYLPGSTDLSEYIRTLHKIMEIDFEKFLISHYLQLIPKNKINNYIHCAANIDKEKSIPFFMEPFPDITGLLFCDGEKQKEDPDYAAIVYTTDRL